MCFSVPEIISGPWVCSSPGRLDETQVSVYMKLYNIFSAVFEAAFHNYLLF